MVYLGVNIYDHIILASVCHGAELAWAAVKGSIRLANRHETASEVRRGVYGRRQAGCLRAWFRLP